MLVESLIVHVIHGRQRGAARNPERRTEKREGFQTRHELHCTHGPDLCMPVNPCTSHQSDFSMARKGKMRRPRKVHPILPTLSVTCSSRSQWPPWQFLFLPGEAESSTGHQITMSDSRNLKHDTQVTSQILSPERPRHLTLLARSISSPSSSGWLLCWAGLWRVRRLSTS